jgi:hypothetical protein
MPKFITTFILSLLFVQSYSQNKSPNSDTLKYVLKQTYETVKQNSVYRKNVDWTSLEPKVLGGLDTLNRFDDFVSRVKLLFSTIGDSHSMLYINGMRIGMDQKPVSSIRKSLKDAYKKEPIPIRYQTKIFQDKYGYIFVPGNNTSENLKRISQALQDSLCNLKPGHLKGIIIDLRLNDGGSIVPLFTGLHQLLGNGDIGGFTDFEEKNTSDWNFKEGKSYTKYGISIKRKCKLSDTVKIAVLVSEVTASAGEMLAIAFRGRKNTIFIGEKTYGLTTGVAAYRIHGYLLGVASSLSRDRTGKIYSDHFVPDIEIIEGDDFQNLNNDIKVNKAIEWFNEN